MWWCPELESCDTKHQITEQQNVSNSTAVHDDWSPFWASFKELQCPFITPQLLDKSQVWRHEFTCNCCKLNKSCSKPSRLRIEAEQFSETNSQGCRRRCIPDFQISQLGIRVLLFFTPLNWTVSLSFWLFQEPLNPGNPKQEQLEGEASSDRAQLCKLIIQYEFFPNSNLSSDIRVSTFSGERLSFEQLQSGKTKVCCETITPEWILLTWSLLSNCSCNLKELECNHTLEMAL
jgi:hypothetical protein